LVIEPLPDAALARAPDERSAYLDDACGGDATLRAQVGRLVAECERLEHDETRYLEQPAALRFASLWDEAHDDAAFRAAMGDRFRIDGEAGRGGMAIVYRAHDLRDDRSVALKVLRTTMSSGASARFRREIAVAARLRHPNIVPVLDSGECGDRLWYTMPLVAGESLGAILHRAGRLPVPDAVRILREISEALACAHGHGIVHRDLKPDNVLMGDGTAAIADFGVAKAVFLATHGDAAPTTDIRTATGVGVGTPAYMAPEQAAGEKSVDHRADLYALGVMAYQILAGVTPFSGESRQALITAHLAAHPAPLSMHRRDVPVPLAARVMRLLAKRPADRPASVTEVIAALGA
jgi:serine/threonine-protein kinase